MKRRDLFKYLGLGALSVPAIPKLFGKGKKENAPFAKSVAQKPLTVKPDLPLYVNLVITNIDIERELFPLSMEEGVRSMAPGRRSITVRGIACNNLTYTTHEDFFYGVIPEETRDGLESSGVGCPTLCEFRGILISFQTETNEVEISVNGPIKMLGDLNVFSKR